MTKTPENNSLIIFTTVPTGSYARIGEIYKATQAKKGHDIRLQNVKTGAGTFDRPSTYRRAVWEPST